MKSWVVEHRLSLGVTLFAILLLLFGLGSYGLLEDNEARFFEIAWEMERSGDWLVPRLNFLPHFHKPPGTFWLVGASLSLWGESEWAGRLPVALASLITIALTWLWMRSEGGPKEAAGSVLVLVTSLEYWFLSRVVLTDMFLTLSITAAMFCAWQARYGRGPWYRWGFWLALGLSALFKGPVGLAVVLPTLGLFSLVDAPRRSWNLGPALGVPLFLAVAAPWYLAVCWRYDGLFEYFLNFQTAQRMLTNVHGRSGPWWFYLPVLLVGFFPWSTSLPLTIRAALHRAEALDRFLLTWVGFALLFFSCAHSKLPTYLLPIFPALAMLTARAGRTKGDSRRVGSFALVSLALFAAAVAGYLKHGLASELVPATNHLLALAALISLVNLALWSTYCFHDDDFWFAAPAFTFGATLLIIAGALGPCDASYSARVLGQRILASETAGEPVVEVADHLHGLPFYLDRRVIQVAYPRETQFEPADRYSAFLFPNLKAYFAAQSGLTPTLIVLRRSDYESFANPSWPVDACGPWLLLQAGSAPEHNTVAAPLSGPAPAGPFHGRAGL